MLTLMSKPKAPCGHDGEHVIGAYVRCLQGCAKDPYVQPQAPKAKRRSQAGHVDYCACKPCTIRRRAKTVVIRTKDGKEARIDWDGATDHFEWVSTIRGYLRHWKIVDADGDLVDEGSMFDRDEVHVGDVLDLDFFTAKATFAIKRSGYRGLQHLDLLYAEHLHKQYQVTAIPDLKAVMTSEPGALKTWRQKAKSANFGWQPLYGVPSSDVRQTSMRDNFGHPRGTTMRDVVALVHGVEGVKHAWVSSPVHGELLVEIDQTTATTPQDERKIQELVRCALKDALSVGTEFRVALKTPLSTVSEACSRLQLGVWNRWHSIETVTNELYEKLRGKLSALRVQVECDGAYFIAQITWDDVEGRAYYRHKLRIY